MSDKELSRQAKKYFAQIRKVERLIKRLNGITETLRASLFSTGVQLRQDKVQTSGRKNGFAETNDKIIDFERDINARKAELVSMKHEAFIMINRIPNLSQRDILLARYIQSQEWEDIAADSHYSMKWVFDQHQKGLIAFSKANSDFLNNGVK